jgi:hypothetical protein
MRRDAVKDLPRRRAHVVYDQMRVGPPQTAVRFDLLFMVFEKRGGKHIQVWGIMEAGRHGTVIRIRSPDRRVRA